MDYAVCACRYSFHKEPIISSALPPSCHRTISDLYWQMMDTSLLFFTPGFVLFLFCFKGKKREKACRYPETSSVCVDKGWITMYMGNGVAPQCHRKQKVRGHCTQAHASSSPSLAIAGKRVLIFPKNYKPSTMEMLQMHGL